MKFFVLLALVGLAFCQSCDVEGDWSTRPWFQTDSKYIGASWEDYEIAAWGMDGGNKWHDFWIRPYAGVSRYEYATCGLMSQGAVPSFNSQCGSCPLIGQPGLTCNCYPFYDVADNSLPVEVGNPPFENANGDQAQWTVENCKQHRPHLIYYYAHMMELEGGNFRQNFGISRAFTPTGSAWDDFCESLDYGFAPSDDCHLPLPTGSSSVSALTGAHFVATSGFYTLGSGNTMDLYVNQMEGGCHYKKEDHRWPSAVFCGDRAGWSYGAGAYGHVRFGCARGTFDTESTDILGIIDDSDCQAVYVGFDELNGLSGGAGEPGFSPSLPGFDPTQFCWYDSDYENLITFIPSYRTPCDQDPSGAAQLAVPFFALLSAFLLVLKNF